MFKKNTAYNNLDLNFSAEASEAYRNGIINIIKQSIVNYPEVQKDFHIFTENNFVKFEEELYINFFHNILFANRAKGNTKAKVYYLIKFEINHLKQKLEKEYNIHLYDNFNEGILSQDDIKTAQENFNLTILDIFAQKNIENTYKALGLKKHKKQIESDLNNITKEIFANNKLENSETKDLVKKKIEKIYLLYVFLTNMYKTNGFEYIKVNTGEEKLREYSAYDIWNEIVIKNNTDTKLFCNDIVNLAVKILQNPAFADNIKEVNTALTIFNKNNSDYHYGQHAIIAVVFNIKLQNGNFLELPIDIDFGKQKVQNNATREIILSKFNMQQEYTYERNHFLDVQGIFISNLDITNNNIIPSILSKKIFFLKNKHN
jgi:hypothetical protein